MTKVFFLFGGETIKERSCLHIHKTYIKNSPKILIIPWTTGDKEKEMEYRDILLEYFKSLGAKEVNFLEKNDDKAVTKKKFANSDIVYLLGGRYRFSFKRN